MQIVGAEGAAHEPDHVHTIDVWYSPRWTVWVVERLNAEGHLVGHGARFEAEDDARECVASWLRAHAETAFVAPWTEAPRTEAARHAAGSPVGTARRAA